jgi:hypothetical protein
MVTGLELLAPSPNIQRYVYGDVPPDAEPEKLTFSGAMPEVGLADASTLITVGGLLTWIWIGIDIAV